MAANTPSSEKMMVKIGRDMDRYSSTHVPTYAKNPMMAAMERPRPEYLASSLGNLSLFCFCKFILKYGGTVVTTHVFYDSSHATSTRE